MLLPACSAVRSSTESNHTRLSNNIQRDSIYLHDSIFVHIRADTVYLEKWHTRYKDRLVTKTDTVTNEVIRTETVQVRYVPSFYKYCAAFAILFVLFLLVRLVLYIKRHFFL